MKRQFLLGLSLSCALWSAAASFSSAFTIQRDYDFDTPLPKTGKVTIRKNIRSLPPTWAFTPCPQNSRLLDFAESTNQWILICSDEQDTDYGKYWIQRPKRGGSYVRLMAPPPKAGEPHPGFRREQQVYRLYSDAPRPERINAYFELYNARTQQGTGEALLYHYSTRY